MTFVWHVLPEDDHKMPKHVSVTSVLEILQSGSNKLTYLCVLNEGV